MLLYVITNKVNNTRYIGQTIQALSKRWISHKKSKSQTFISRAIQKHGPENFEIRVLSRCNSVEELNHREQYYIKLFNTMAPNGYNLTTGGDRPQFSLETRNKISVANKGKKKGPMSKATRLKLADINRGKKHSSETKRKMSDSHSGPKNVNYGKTMSIEQREKLSISHIGQVSQKRKPVLCVTTNIQYESLTEASKQLGIRMQAISRVCLSERNHTHNLVFKYVD